MKNKLLLVEDDPVWRAMLTRFINNEPDLDVVHAVESKDEAITYCTRNKVDIVLMDINLSDDKLDGIQATLQLSLMQMETKVIALTSLDDENVILDAFTAGAIHYVKKSDFRKIPDIIRGVIQSISPQEILVKDYLRLKEAEQYNKLTAAEKEIILLGEAGHNRTFIANKLRKSESTLKNQVTSILRKFKAGSIKEVIRMIKRRGLGN